MQNSGGFSHLYHESRAAAGQIVRRANAGKNTVDRTYAGPLSRNIAADMRKNDDKCGLAHIGAFAAHVRAGDD